MHWRFSRYSWKLLPGSLTALVCAGLLSLGALQPLEQLAYSALYQLRGEQAWDDRLVLIAIDDASIKRIGRFPWSRDQYVKLLHVLSKKEAKEASAPSVVVFDLLWSEPSPDDAKLAQSGRVVLAQARDGTGLPLLPVPILQDAAIATGHIFMQSDQDGLTRRVNLYDNGVPALGLAAVEAYTLVSALIPLPKNVSGKEQPLWLNWAGHVQHVQQYSFSDVIQGRVPEQAWRDKIVLVGLTATGINPLVTPFDRNPPATGVYLNAAVMHDLLQQKALQPVPFFWSLLILVLVGPWLSLLLSDRREVLQALVLVGLWLGWGGLSLLLFHQGYWVPVALPLGLCSLTTIAVVVVDRWRLAASLQVQVQQLWQRHQSDLILRVPSLKKHDDVRHNDVKPYQKAGLVQSVTRLTTLAEQFARSQSAQAAIARNLPIGLLAADLDGRVWFCNPAAANWLKATIGSNLRACLIPMWLSETDYQSALQALQQQHAVTAKDCQQGDRWFALYLEPLLYQPELPSLISDNHPPDGLLLLLEDITSKKQVEVALEQQVQELQRVAVLKDDFLSTVSHELRSPMANIKMASELLKISHTEVASSQYLKILQTECDRETHLINDLLDLQRLEAGAQNYQPERINLNDWLPPILQSFSERAETQQQKLTVALPQSMPFLVSDQPSLERIVVELVNNACKYTPPAGEIKVAVHWTAHQIEFIVDNSGTEIPAAEMPRIFEKFYRVPQSDPWKRGGTGLGLALVSRLVDYLGGKISVNSGAGHTTFTVQLPLVEQKLSGE